LPTAASAAQRTENCRNGRASTEKQQGFSVELNKKTKNTHTIAPYPV